MAEQVKIAKPKRRGFDTGQEQYVGGQKYDPRNQWGSGPFPGITRSFPDLPMGGYFMTGEQIAKAGPNYDPSYYSSPGEGLSVSKPQPPGKADYVPTQPATSQDPNKLAMERIIQGIEESTETQKNLLARYRPGNAIREKSIFA